MTSYNSAPIVRHCWILTVYSILTCLATPAGSIAWWSTIAQLSAHAPKADNGLSSAPSHRALCAQLEGLSPGQARICELFLDHMPVVGFGVKNSIEECQWQFRYRRWNCSNPNTGQTIGPVHALGTPEAAFTYAMLSAGVAHEISRTCRLGLLSSCGCNQEKRPPNLQRSWMWGGCGDNIHYGCQFTQNFIDICERERDYPKNTKEYAKSLMNRWNNEVGRKVIKRKSRVTCKCHGVSGSCSLKTCWKQAPSIRELGQILLDRYDTAVRVKINRRGNLQLVKNGKKRRAAQMDLVYLDDPPDYCRYDEKSSTAGTEGRECNKTGHGMESCELLCCGRGYNTFKKVVTEKCECKFVWCCRVACKTCQTKIEVHKCK
ncbi:Protein Wnt-2 [Trichinella pseudospiralis]|uniref:Protein Wnt n=1 Tax=Trichinella pseudospiralis TaxID=6337 RepID=A0A0V1JF83_TRIPS|nr:Protein Wnt-2 [Trichinella pseudospiralis]KRY74362.1 Protein Wnt-2 [Trichinella pseudospiralis]KRZ33616.1 Protein Wnt-2 [Trichinella pseudospiralis]KRZ40348.1 Protein Wnt-2 [Trichinella pseudospiralis]